MKILIELPTEIGNNLNRQAARTHRNRKQYCEMVITQHIKAITENENELIDKNQLQIPNL